jgi:ABC-type branched-subunit amino acid transport system substrate-binding protein
MAAAALMKIGGIQALLKDYPRARAAYERTITEYPEGEFAKDARVALLTLLYQQGAFREVIEEAATTLEAVDSAERIFRTYAIVGDAYMSLDSPLDAVEFYAQARQYAPAEDQAAIEAKLREAILRLQPDEVNAFIDRAGSILPPDFVLYQLGMIAVMQQNYDQAMAIFEEFNHRFPDHEKREAVAQMMAQIQRDASFNPRAVGCLLPLSGAYQAFGQRAMRGLEMALDGFRRQNAGVSIQILVKDTGSDPDQTLRAVQALKDEGAAAIIGPLVHVELAAREAQTMGIPIITLTQKDHVTDIGENVFRNFLTPRMQVRALVSFAVEDLGAMRFAILYPDEVYGQTFMDLFWTELQQYGAQVVGVESYDPTQTDFSDPIRRLVGLYYPTPPDLIAERPKGQRTTSHRSRARSGDPADAESEEEVELEAIVDFDAIFIPESPKTAGLLIPQLAFHDVREVVLIGTNLWHSQDLLDLAGQYAQGAVVPDGFFAASPDAGVQAFVQRFEDTYGEKPGYIEAVIYDSAMILFDVVTRPDVRFRNDIRKALLDAKGFDGVTGLTRFDETGEALKRAYLLRIEGDEFVEMGRR